MNKFKFLTSLNNVYLPAEAIAGVCRLSNFAKGIGYLCQSDMKSILSNKSTYIFQVRILYNYCEQDEKNILFLEVFLLIEIYFLYQC